MPSDHVRFKRVETKRSKGAEWTFSDMEVFVSKTLDHERIRSSFSHHLKKKEPKPIFKIVRSKKKETIVHVALGGFATHRITLIPSEKTVGITGRGGKKPANVAIIIDDLGYDYDLAKKFLSLDGNVTLSVLPHSPFQKRIATAAQKKGRDLLLHLPMEPLEYPDVNPGKGVLLESMGAQEIRRQLKENLEALPTVVGVNNHMGSRLTQNSEKMRQIFTVLKDRGLFFVDSLTSPHSQCRSAARALGLKFASRNIFLDNVQETRAIELQMKRLISIAKNRGQAIGIGHAYPITWAVLNRALPEIQQEVNIVPISTLVR